MSRGAVKEIIRELARTASTLPQEERASWFSSAVAAEAEANARRVAKLLKIVEPVTPLLQRQRMRATGAYARGARKGNATKTSKVIARREAIRELWPTIDAAHRTTRAAAARAVRRVLPRKYDVGVDTINDDLRAMGLM